MISDDSEGEAPNYSATDHRAEAKPFWLASPHTGRKRHYDDPEKLLEDAVDYMNWVHENPLWEHKTVGSEGMIVRVPKMRAATLNGLLVYLRMSAQSWSDYRKNPIFSDVVEQIDQAIREQKFVGAAAGFLNANIIARDLGLAEKTDNRTATTIEVIDNFSDPEGSPDE